MPKFTKRNKAVEIAVPKPTAPDLSPSAPDSARKWRNRITGHAEVEAKSLLANPKNWRIHPKNQVDALAGVLSEVGWVQDCIVNQRSGFVVDGHARVALAIKANEMVPVVYVDLSDEEEALILATLDPLSAMAEKDDKLLAELLGSIVVGDDALKALCLDLAGEKVAEGLTEPDACPEVQADPITVPGDLWLLGSHRLLCGDSTDALAFERLMAGRKAGLMATDPPYGVKYDSSWRAKYSSGEYSSGTIENDDRADWREVWALWNCPVAYVWHGGLHAAAVAESLTACDYELRAQIIWNKSVMVFGRGAYHWKHEPCWYAVKKDANANWQGDRTQNTVWESGNVSGAGRTGDVADDFHANHISQKPVELFRIPIRNHTAAGALIAEPFAGSGSQFIAAEELGRICFGMELDPKYCDMIVRRWQKFTGQEATLDGDSIGGGRTFASLAAERVPVQAPAAVALAE